LRPDLGRDNVDLIQQARLPHGVAELRPVDRRCGLLRQQEVVRAGLPTRAILTDASAGNDEVRVRMIDRKVTSPRVQRTEETQTIGADETRSRRQERESSGCRRRRSPGSTPAR